MISHQDARRNLSPGELIYANSMVAEEIALENKEKMSIGGKVGADITNKKTPCVQMDTPRDYSTNTRQQVAKMSGVGTGTVARYDAIMKTDNEDLKKKVQTGEVKIGTAYREIKQAEKNSSKVNGIYKEIANSYAGTQHSGHFGEFCDTKKTTDKNFTQDDVVRAYKDTKVLKNALDMLDIKDEFDTIEEDIKQRINTYKNRLFNVYDIQKKITFEEKEYGIKKLNVLINEINNIIIMIKGE